MSARLSTGDANDDRLLTFAEFAHMTILSATETEPFDPQESEKAKEEHSEEDETKEE